MESLNRDFRVNLSKIVDATGFDKKDIKKKLISSGILEDKNKEYSLGDVIFSLYGEQRQNSPLRKIHTVWISKGGVSKTTTVTYLSLMLALRGYKILLIDLDSQLNLSNMMGASNPENMRNISDLLDKEVDPNTLPYEVLTNLDIIIGTSDVNGLIRGLEVEYNSDNYFKRKLKNSGLLEKYDFVFFDAHSSENKLLRNALSITDNVILPLNPDTFSIQGFRKTMEVLEICSESFEKEIDYRILFTKYSHKNANHDLFLDSMSKNVVGKAYSTIIRNLPEIENSISLMRPLEIKSTSNGYKLLNNLVSEFEGDQVYGEPLHDIPVFDAGLELMSENFI